MFQRSLLPFALVALFCSPLFAEKSQDDLKALEGKWTPSAAEAGGNALPDEELKKIKLTITGEKYSVDVESGTDKGSVKVNAGATPKTVDFAVSEGPNNGKTFLAIYEIVDKDTFRACFALEGDRPTEFKTAGNEKHVLITFKREKP